MKLTIFHLFAIVIISILFNHQAFAVGAGITYHGRLIDPSGNPVVGTNVQFKLQIRTPGNENCLMYEEVQVKDLSQGNGVFSVTINDGTGTRLDSSGYAIDQIFANRGTFSFAGGQCVTGSSFAPNPTDGRKIQVYFNDGTFNAGTWEPSPPMPINFVPLAIESMQIGGYKKEQLIKLADGVTTTGSELDATKWGNLLALINGTSTAYTKPTDQVTQLYGATIPAPVTGQSIRWNGALNAGAGGWENFTPGTAVSVTNVTAGTGLNVGAGPGGAITTTGTLNIDVGTTTGKIVQVAAADKLPAIDGSNLTNINASSVGGTGVSLASITNGQVLKYNGTNWVNATLVDNDTLGGLSCANGRVAYFTGGAWACLEVANANTVNTIVSRDGAGLINVSTANMGSLKINNGAMSDITLTTPAAFTSYAMKLPVNVGTNGYALTTDGGSPAQLSWSPMTSSQWTTTGSDIYYNTGNVGIGVNNPWTRMIVQDVYNSPSVDRISSYVLSLFSPTGAATTNLTGFKSYTNPSVGGAETGVIRGIDSTVNNIGSTSSIASAIGMDSRIVNQASSSSARIVDATGLKAHVDQITVFNVPITNAKAGDFSVTKLSGTIDNAYGVYTGSIEGTNKWSVYASDSTAPSYFAGSVGIGTSSPVETKFEVVSEPTNTVATTYAQKTTLNYSPAVASSQDSYGLSVSANYTGGLFVSSTGSIIAIDGKAENASSGAIGTLIGGNFQAKNGPGQNVTTAYGVKSSVIGAANVGTGYGVYGEVNRTANSLSNAYGVYGYVTTSGAAAPAITTAYGLYGAVSRPIGTIVSGYGLYTGTIEATNKWSIYASDATAPSYFAGNVGLGTTTPQDKLDINGNIRVAKNSAQPYACDAAHDAVIALTSQYTTCVCKGGSTSWVQTTDGTTACTW